MVDWKKIADHCNKIQKENLVKKGQHFRTYYFNN